MNSSIRTSSLGTLLLLTALTLATTKTTSAATILFDSLTTPTPENLDGTTVAGANGVWTQNFINYAGVFKTTPDGATAGVGAGNSIILPVTITPGNIYSLSATISGGSGAGQGNIAYLGFDNSQTSDLLFYNIQGPVVQIGQTGANINPFSAGSFTYNNPATPQNGIQGGNSLTLVLDTTSSLWTVSAYLQGNLIQTYDYSANPSGFDSIVLSQIVDNKPNDYIDFSDLKFSTGLVIAPAFVPIPEPATFAYLVSGLALLAVCLRRKRC